MNNDKVLKEKLNSLDTLSTGIVFGKEEAWDKLQARMDKPAKVISLKYWMAAAAILLLFVTIFLAFNDNTPVHEVVKNIPQQPIPANNTITTPVEQPAITVEKNIPVITHKAIKHTTITKEKPITQPKTEEVQIVQAPVVEAPVENIVPATTAPVASVSKIPTKVVHVNDLVNEPASSGTALNVNTSFKIVTGQVIHLNDFTDHQVRLNSYLKQQKGFVFSIPLLNRPSAKTTGSENNENSIPDNLLKFKLN